MGVPPMSIKDIATGKMPVVLTAETAVLRVGRPAVQAQPRRNNSPTPGAAKA